VPLIHASELKFHRAIAIAVELDGISVNFMDKNAKDKQIQLLINRCCKNSKHCN
jgi:hypothetical protein